MTAGNGCEAVCGVILTQYLNDTEHPAKAGAAHYFIARRRTAEIIRDETGYHPNLELIAVLSIMAIIADKVLITNTVFQP